MARTRETNPTKVYLLAYTDFCDRTYYKGIYSSEYEARKHSIGCDIIEFEFNKEDSGVYL